MIPRILPALLIVLTSSLVAIPAPPVNLESDNNDIVYLSATRPILMRVDLTSDGRAIESKWRRFIDMLFIYLDKNNDDCVDKTEIENLPLVMTFITSNTIAAIPLPAERANGIFREQLATHLRQNGYGPFRLPVATPQPQVQRLVMTPGGSEPDIEALDKRIIQLLDTDHDGKLSQAELIAAEAVLGLLDSNEDEFVSIAELMKTPAPNPYMNLSVNRGASSMMSPSTLYKIPNSGTDFTLADRLFKAYSRGADGKPTGTPKKSLTAKELGISAESFAKLDRDENGTLDAAELSLFSKCAIDVELTVNVGKPSATKKGVTRKTPKKSSASIPSTTSENGEEIVLKLGTTQVRVVTTGSSALNDNLQNRLLLSFRNADRDGNGYVDAMESMNDPNMSTAFKLMDADGDEKVFEKEVKDFAAEISELMKVTHAGFAVVDIADRSKGLFGLFDTDGDGSLSPRELKQLPKLLNQPDIQAEGGITAKTVPTQFVMTFHQGLRAAEAMMPQGVVFVGNGMPEPPKLSAGPLWYQRMDRNKDGDVSRREFLGAEDDFRKLDKNGDGLIDAKEAETADRLFSTVGSKVP